MDDRYGISMSQITTDMFRLFPFRTCQRVLKRIPRRVSLVEQELRILPEHAQFVAGVHVPQFLVFIVMLC